MKPRNGESDFDRLLRLPDKGITEVRGIGGVMAMMARQILYDEQITPGVMEKNLIDFVDSARGSITTKSLRAYFNRSNLRREIISPKMTFKGVVKLLRILRVKSFKMNFELTYHHVKTVSRHTVCVDLGHPQNAHLDEDYDDEEV